MAGSSGNSPAARRVRNSSTDPTPASAEQPLPPGQHGRQLGDGPPHHVRLPAARDRTDVREVGEHRQAAAAEVQHVHAQLGRRVGEREGEQRRAQRPGLARTRAPDHREMPRGVGEVEHQRVASLLVGAVDQADGDAQRPRVP